MSLYLPPTSSNLLYSVSVPSGYANYFLLAYNQMAVSGETPEEFLVRQVIYQSVERYRKYIIQQDYLNTISSGDLLEANHSNFVISVMTEEQQILGNYLK